ncbi:MAG: hypothetical protein JNJ46_13800 [Myxococcales bacterium]|nr:hypothetical protein [Myxococcales bacterium]
MRSRWTRHALCALAAACWMGSSVEAGQVEPGIMRLPPSTSELRTSERFEKIVQEARELHASALRIRRRENPERISLLQRSITLLSRALLLHEHHVETRVLLGSWLAHTELGDVALKQAEVELLRARRDDVSRAYDCEIAGILGVVYSHLQRPSDAVAEYDRALRLLPGEPELVHLSRRRQEAMILGNSAEALMAMGKLDEAIRRYALAESIDRSEQATLHALGLAIAYDRDGQVQKSRDAVARALGADPGLRLFQSDDVFFIPEGDRHYYWGLINEAQERRDEALRSFRAFLDELPHSRYAARARSHIEDLKRQPGLSIAELMRAQVLLAPPQFPAEAMSGSGTPRKHRSEAEIQRITTERVFDLRHCYARALQRTPKLRGDLLLGMMLDRSGAVVLVQTIESTLGVGGGELPARSESNIVPVEARYLLSCVQGAVQRWRFSPADPDNVDADELALPMRFTTGL